MARLFASLMVLLMWAVFASAQTSAPESQACAEAKALAARLETRLNDWPALARYGNDNAKVGGASKDEKRVVFMGDSITDFWVRPESGGFFPGKPYIDRGISGQMTQQMLVRFHPDVVALKPKVVVILGGTNDLAVGNDLAGTTTTGPSDILKAIKDNLTSMVELARANDIRVVLASLLPVHDYGMDKSGKPLIQSVRRRPDQIKALNEWMRSFAAENNLTYLDYHSAMVDEKGFLREELSNDGLHPNNKGYAVMSPLAEQAIAAAFKKKK